MQARRIAVITGANRGLGLETSRQLARRGYRVVLTAREPDEAEAAAAQLGLEGLDVVPYTLDVAVHESVTQLASWMRTVQGRWDILVNNAGIIPDPANGGDLISAEISTLRQAMEVNAYGAVRLMQAAIPMMRDHRYGRIVNVSSGMGQLSDMGPGYPAYRASKAALNAFTRIAASETRGTGILINAVCPGWVRTALGGPHATRSVEEGTAGIVWAALLPDNGPTGSFFRDGREIAW